MVAEDVKCHAEGYFCGPTCKTLFHCIDLGTGELVLETLLTCGDNQFCNIDTKSCSTMPDHCSPVQPIRCDGAGMFPSPYNCSAFFYCSSINQFPSISKCPEGQIFDPCNYDCNLGNCLTVPVPVCNAILQSGAIPNTNNKYYVCNANFYPEQHSCNGTIFDSSTNTCTKVASVCKN